VIGCVHPACMSRISLELYGGQGGIRIIQKHPQQAKITQNQVFWPVQACCEGKEYVLCACMFSVRFGNPKKIIFIPP
jgi:hypothetical protein